MSLSPIAEFFRKRLLSSCAEKQIRSDRVDRKTCASTPCPDDPMLTVVRREGDRTFVVDSLLGIRLPA